MALATASLPSDPEGLRALALALQEALATKDRELAARDAEIYSKTLYIEKLRATLALMKRARFGRSSERIEQLELLISDLEEEAAAQQARRDAAVDPRPSTTKERRTRGRQPLPAHLPRERVVHEPACACPTCGSTALTRVGADEREVLEYVPSHFKVVVHVRPKMSCRRCETVIQAPAPSLPIERGRPGPNLLAHVLVAKYCDHTPLHRQSVIYGRAGVELERSTLADWVGQAAFLLEPVGDFSRFANPRQLMAYLGLVPSEHSSGSSIRRGGITKAGNAHARRVLIEGAWTYCMQARVSRKLLDRIERLPQAVREVAWKALGLSR